MSVDDFFSCDSGSDGEDAEPGAAKAAAVAADNNTGGEDTAGQFQPDDLRTLRAAAGGRRRGAECR